MTTQSGITYQSLLPLAWEATAPDAPAIALVRHHNLRLLHALAIMESLPDKDVDSDPVVAKAMERLEAKLDMVISLLSRLAARDEGNLRPTRVSLGATHLDWEPLSETPGIGDTVKLTLYLSPMLPEGIQLYARITDSTDTNCRAEFLDQDEEFEEWMTRTLFRYHRRELQARHPT